MTSPAETDLAINVENVTVEYSTGRGLALLRSKRRVQILQDVSLSVRTGFILGLAGESGSGKTTMARVLTGLASVSTGSVSIHGRPVHDLDESEWRWIRSHVQLIFQDPFDSLNPRFTVFRAVAEPLISQGLDDTDELARRVRSALVAAELDPVHMSRRRPHHLSGGERQRVAIARALVVDPSVIVADEPVSMLDVSTSGQILRLLRAAADERGVAVLLISHDLSVLEKVCDEIAIMYLGRIVERGPIADIFANPRHPYTNALVSAIPNIARSQKRVRTRLHGEPPEPSNRPPGCAFHPRCPQADTSECQAVVPVLSRDDHAFACWHPIEIQRVRPS